MAKKKSKGKASHTKKRHRVSGTAQIMHVVGQLLAAGAGGVAGVFGVNAAKTALGSKMPDSQWLFPAGALATGGAILGFAKKMPYAPEFGLGLATVGGVMTLNELGVNMPGISGLAMSNNAPAGTAALSKAVGCNNTMSGGPSAYLNRTVGARNKMNPMTIGALASD